MKLVLVFPDFQVFSHLDQNWIQHGIAHLYTETKKARFDVEYWDGRIMPFGIMCEKIVNTSEITHIGVNVLSVYRDNALALLKYIQENRPDITTIAGGVHVTALPEEFVDRVHYIVVGEGEKVLQKILKGSISRGIVKGYTENLDELEYIDRSIFPFEETPINPCLPKPFATVINSRACPGECTFCAPIAKNLFGKKYKQRSVEHLVGEIKSLNLKSFFLHDDNAMGNLSYMHAFCDAVKPLGLKWWNQGRADTISNHPEIVEHMADAGCTGMLVGFESGSNRILKYIKKGVTREQNIKACHTLHANDMTVWANLMVGFPTEQPHEVLETMMMVQEMAPDLVSICTFTPFPGSYLYEYCKENKLMPEKIDQSYFNRGQFEQKIIGPDYLFLEWAVSKMCRIAYSKEKL